MTVIRCTELVLPLLFDLVTLGIAVVDSSIRISYKLYSLRVLKPGYVIFLPTPDGTQWLLMDW